LVIFFLFPRIGMGFFFARQRHGQTLSGFSERVDLGMHGAIKNNPQVVMRIEFPQGGEDRALGLHMPGVAFCSYALGGQWQHTQHTPGNKTPLSSDGGVVRAPGTLAGDRPGLVQDIYLDPLNSNVLFGASRPVRFEVPPPTLPGHPRMGLYRSDQDEVYTSVE